MSVLKKYQATFHAMTKSENNFWYRWMLKYSLGEFFGIAVAAIIARFLFADFSGTSAAASATMTFTILAMAGAAEGIITGYIQWICLSKLVKNFKPLPWLMITTLATIVGWLLLLPPTVVFLSFLSTFSLIHNYYSLVYTALLGVAFGALIGLSQFFVIRKFYDRAIFWVFANIAGWTLSFMVIYLAISMMPVDASFVNGLSIVAGACILSGFIQGVVVGAAIHFSMRIKKGPKDNIPLK